jgi:hypothetical protein
MSGSGNIPTGRNVESCRPDRTAPQMVDHHDRIRLLNAIMHD